MDARGAKITLSPAPSNLKKSDHQVSAELFRQFLSAYSAATDAKLNDEEIERAVKDYLNDKGDEVRLLPAGVDAEHVRLIPSLVGAYSTPAKKPVIVDLGCGGIFSFFYLLDIIPCCHYIGVDRVEQQEMKQATDVINKISKQFDFNFLKLDIIQQKNAMIENIKRLTGSDKVDFVLLNNFAAGEGGGAENISTYSSLITVIDDVIPSILSPRGSFYITATTMNQIGVLDTILRIKNIDYIRVHNSYICGEAARSKAIIELFKKLESTGTNVFMFASDKRQKAPGVFSVFGGTAEGRAAMSSQASGLKPGV